LEESFADESYWGHQWYRTEVIAHIRSSDDIDWIVQIECEAAKLGYYDEVKASFALRLIKRLDPKSQRRIWHAIQDIKDRYFFFPRRDEFLLRPMNLPI
jgi:hypothetical protein